MKAHVLSDLHVTRAGYDLFKTDADIAILAGDIAPGVLSLAWLTEQLRKTDLSFLFVPGNHEFYHWDIQKLRLELRTQIAALNATLATPRIYLLDNDAVVLDGVRFLGTTLWTDFELYGKRKLRASMVEALRMKDFSLIRHGQDAFSPQNARALFNTAVTWLTAELDKPFEGRTVVVTHHLPSFDSVSEKYKKDPVSAGFASHLDHLFGKMDVWIHGHTHTSFDYIKNGTRVICNPRGYSRFDKGVENFDFNPSLVLDL